MSYQCTTIIKTSNFSSTHSTLIRVSRTSSTKTNSNRINNIMVVFKHFNSKEPQDKYSFPRTGNSGNQNPQLNNNSGNQHSNCNLNNVQCQYLPQKIYKSAHSTNSKVWQVTQLLILKTSKSCRSNRSQRRYLTASNKYYPLGVARDQGVHHHKRC